MTPATTLNAPIYAGAKWEHTLSFKQSGTSTPVNLTGLTPLVVTFKNTSRSVVADASVSVVGDDPTAGVITVSLTAAQTLRFPVGSASVTIGIRDALNNPYLEASLDVKPFTPDPA